jgi:Thaumatin family
MHLALSNTEIARRLRVRAAAALPTDVENRSEVKRIPLIALLALVFGSLPATLWTVSARAQGDSCLDNLPTPQLQTGLHRVVQLVNCSQHALLGTANAAQQKGKNPLPVLPREGTWIMGPVRSGSNVLTLDIPLEWEDTKCPASAHGMCQGILGPRFWARTGCRYDIPFDKAQCETGGCGGRYDCSAARLAASVGTTVSEWTFNEPVTNGTGTISYFKDSPDISAVDGLNLNMDIQPLGGDAHDPFDTPPNCHDQPSGCTGHDIQWLAEQYPLTAHGQDPRADANCSPANFRLMRSTLTTGKPYGFVIADKSGQPVGGDNTVACFSNCGEYAFPTPPALGCDETKDARCFRWKSFCLGDPSKYGQKCNSDADCPVAGACWDQHDPTSPIDHTCQGRAFIKNPGTFPIQGSDLTTTCPENVCTYPYGYVDTSVTPNITYFSTQPPFGDCKNVNSAIAPYDSTVCIGDDTLHNVVPKAYTWPNDPQVYGGDAPAYRVIFAPGGTTQNITGTSTIPFCQDLDEKVYGGAKNKLDCGNVIDYGALFAVAHPSPTSWSCDLDPTGAGDEGVICRWKQTTKIQQIGLRSNFNSGGSSLQLSVVPGVTQGDLLLASITFFNGATPTPPSGWTQVPGASVVSNSDNQTVVWQHFVGANPEPASYTWTWNAAAFPAGGITAWRGVDNGSPFDGAASVDNGTGIRATAPSLTTLANDERLITVFGAGNATGQSFNLPINQAGAIDETGALKVFGGPALNTNYAHLVADRHEAKKGPTSPQTVVISSSSTPPDPNLAISDWTAISMALKPHG